MNNNKIIQLRKPFNYIDIGTGEILLLVHGWVDAKENWEFNIDALSKKYRVITFDLPGCNGVADIYPPNIAGYCDFLESFIEKTGLRNKKITLIGHSLGASVILSFVKKHIKYINKVVLMDLILTEPNEKNKFISEFLLTYKKTKLLRYLIKILKASQPYKNYIVNLTSLRTSKNAKRIAEVTELGLDKCTVSAFIEGYADILTLETARDLKILDKTQIPYLLIYGKEDKVVSLPLLSRLDFVKNNVCFIQNSNHCPNREVPELFNEKLLSFLAK